MSRWTTVNKAKARARKSGKVGGMNKTEAEYAGRLEGHARLGYIVSWAFERVSFKLGEGCWYRPDFYVVGNDHVEIHEVKGTRGFKLDPQGRVKLRVAAALHPELVFFQAVKQTKKAGGGFAVEEVKA